jgi:hypothetical protein
MRQTFSAVLDSKKQVKNITLSDIGQLEEVKFTEGLLLEVVGTKGVLRIDLPVETLRKVVEKTR